MTPLTTVDSVDFTHAIKNCCCPLNTCGFASFAFCFIRQEPFSMLCKPAVKVSHN